MLPNTDPDQTHTNASTPVKILVVDDDLVSVMAIKRALKKLRIVNPIRVAKDGQEALDILRGEKGNTQILPPYLVTLDLNMPRMNGIEFLDELRKDPSLHRVVVFVLTTSDTHDDIASAYDKNVAGYILKDGIGESFAKALDLIDTYARLVVLPD